MPSEPEVVQHAVVSTFDLFSIGIGPSSSHTVGPMRAANIFIKDLDSFGALQKVRTLRVDLYGSLALTGVGHGTPNAILVGLEGNTPELVDPKMILRRVEQITNDKVLWLNGEHRIQLCPKTDIHFHYSKFLPQHPNGMRVSCYSETGDLIAANEFYSIGGGFVVNENTELESNVYYKDRRVDHNRYIKPTEKSHQEALEQLDKIETKTALNQNSQFLDVALPFDSGDSLMKLCQEKNMSIAQVVFQNELKWRDADEITARTLDLWNVMNASIHNGITSTDEYLPGNLAVKRRAPNLYRKTLGQIQQYMGIQSHDTQYEQKPVVNSGVTSVVTASKLQRPNKSLPALDYLSMYAIAINEENAAGGRVVTAPTNGSAGTIPAVLKYYLEFISSNRQQQTHDIVEFLLTSAAIGMLFKRGASISAAEMGCQGEIGVACSMAAAGLTSVMGGTVQQIENAAEIGLEHNLGLTCDPPGGLVAIPCIERNALAAVKVILYLLGRNRSAISIERRRNSSRIIGSSDSNYA